MGVAARIALIVLALLLLVAAGAGIWHLRSQSAKREAPAEAVEQKLIPRERLLRIPEDPDHDTAPENHVDLKPEGPDVLDIDLPYLKDGYGVTPPLHVEIKDGVVVVALEGMDVADMNDGTK